MLAALLWTGGLLLIDALYSGAPLLIVRFADYPVIVYLASGLLLIILLASAFARRAHDTAAQLQAAAPYLADAVFICTPRGRIRWQNAAAHDLLNADRLPDPLIALIARAKKTRRVTTQTISLREGVRCAAQAVPLDGATMALICRALQSETSKTTFYENFIRRIVHDMRNPLAGIIGHAANLSAAPTIEADAWRKSAATIEGEAQRLARLVDSMLFDARLAYVPLEATSLDLIDVLEEAVYAHDERAQREGKAIALEAPPAPMRFHGDRDLLTRAFENLIDNSLKYSNGNGRLTVRAEIAPQAYTIAFKDNGSGIPPEYLPDRIFEPLVRARPQGSGSGLGLSIVRKIVEMHGGSVTAASRVGEGTTMLIRLPRAHVNESVGVNLP